MNIYKPFASARTYIVERWNNGEQDAGKFLETEAKYRKLLDALHDAIRRPMGVIPSSAEPFVTDEGLKEAEARRMQSIIIKNRD